MAKKVVVYSTSTCPHCRNLKSFLNEHNIPFENKDVAQDREALREMREKSGQMGVPVVDIEGTVIVGFDKKAVSQALEI